MIEKALELIGAVDHGKTFRLSFVLARRNQYANVGKLFLFLNLIHIKFDNTYAYLRSLSRTDTAL